MATLKEPRPPNFYIYLQHKYFFNEICLPDDIIQGLIFIEKPLQYDKLRFVLKESLQIPLPKRK